MPPKLRVSGGEGALCCDLEYETTGLFGDGDVLGLQLTACSVDVNRCRAGRNCAFLWKLRIAQFQLISLLSFVLIAAELWVTLAGRGGNLFSLPLRCKLCSPFGNLGCAWFSTRCFGETLVGRGGNLFSLSLRWKLCSPFGNLGCAWFSTHCLVSVYRC